MEGLDALLQEYFAGWNAHDSERVAAVFSREGTYRDPFSSMDLHAFDLKPTMQFLVAAFPDLRFQTKTALIQERNASVEWLLEGTNTGPLLPGVEPAGRALHLHGVDLFQLNAEEQRFYIVERCFDRYSFYHQLGLQLIVEPFTQGKATYGYAKRVASGNSAPPAVLGVTWIEFRDAAELDRIRVHSAQIIQSFLDEPGFLSIVTGAAGNRAFTVTAWEDETAMHRALDRAHAQAKQEFRTGDIAPAVWTSVWSPARINRLWLRCPACHTPNDVSSGKGDASLERTCRECGAPLPPAPLYW